MIHHMSLFSNSRYLTKEEEIRSWKSFGDSLSSKEDRELFEISWLSHLVAVINTMGGRFAVERLIVALLLSEHKWYELSRQTK